VEELAPGQSGVDATPSVSGNDVRRVSVFGEIDSRQQVLRKIDWYTYIYVSRIYVCMYVCMYVYAPVSR